MDAVVGLLNEISTPVKIGWVMWVVWGAFQIVWYQRTRTPAAVALKLERRRRQSSGTSPESSGSMPAGVGGPATGIDVGGSPEFLAGLGLLEPNRKQYGTTLTTSHENPHSVR